MEKKVSIVTPDNYCEVRNYINDQIDHFMINSENWVLVQFREIAAEPTPESILALNGWIDQYLPKRTVREMAAQYKREQNS